MMLNNADAGPVGRRRSCSQFCRVFTLTPIKCANSDCERLVRSRIARTPEEPMEILREGVFSPRRIAPASRTLPKSSSNISLFMTELLFDDSGELRNLLCSQIRRHVLGVSVEQQEGGLHHSTSLPWGTIPGVRNVLGTSPSPARVNFGKRLYHSPRGTSGLVASQSCSASKSVTEMRPSRKRSTRCAMK